MDEHGHVELARIKYRCLAVLPFTSLVSVVTLAVYLCFRVKCIVVAHTRKAEVQEVLNASLYFAAELGIFCMSGPPLLLDTLHHPRPS